MIKKILNHIMIMVIMLSIFFGSVMIGQIVTELVSSKSTFLNIVGFSLGIVFIYLFIVSIPLLFFKFRNWLREKFKMEV